MNVNYIALAIPFFFLFIGIEAAFSAWHKKQLYRLNDSINNLSCGITEQLLDVFFKGLIATGYLYLYANHRMFEIPTSSVVGWTAVFLGQDLCYYWFHRASHEVAFIWGAHIGHHQSEEFNLSVALRQAAFQKWLSWPFYLPLAVIGFPPVMFIGVAAFSTLYQFWIHTRLIGKLGPFEWIFNTPSHHRVHHGSDLKYLDRNYGGTLIIWDRMFGSFQVEEEEPKYGITKQFASWNPLWAHVHYWVDLARDSRRIPKIADKIRLWLKPPGWHPQNYEAPVAPAGPPTTGKYDPKAPLGVNLYVLFQFVPALYIAVRVIDLAAKNTSLIELSILTGIVVVTLLCCGALLELKDWGFRVELARLVLLSGLLLVGTQWVPVSAAWLVVLLGGTVLSTFWLLSYRSEFGRAQSSVAAG